MVDKVFAGTIVLPDRIVDNGYVLVGDGKVQSVGSGGAPDGEKHGGRGFLVFPGAIDAQVHSRSQLGQEDFIWSTRSAAAGGVTTIVDMPYDDNCLIATAERFRTKAKEAAAQARVDFALYATIDPEEGAARVDELVEAGAAAFKFSTFGTHPKRFPRIPPHMLYAKLLRRRQKGADRRHPQRERRDGPRLHCGGRGQGDHRLHRARPVAAADLRGAGDR